MKPLYEIVPKKVRFLRRGKCRTKPSILEKEHIVLRLACAFLIGANQTEAAAYAGCSRTALKNHIHGGSLVEVTMGGDSPETAVVPFHDLVLSWRSYLGLLAKAVVYDDIISAKSGTKYAWKVLALMQPDEWGKRGAGRSITAYSNQ